MKKLLLAASIIFPVFFSGCTQRIVDYTIISTKNLDLARAAEFKRDSKRVQGEDPVYIIIFIPTGISNMKEAIDNAIESVPGAVALLDGVVYVRSFYIPFIYGEQTFVVEGRALIDPKELSASDKPFSGYNIVHLDDEGSIVELKNVSEEEYQLVKDASIPRG